ncbi:MAG: hypothetical protein HDS64_11890 [Bacteroidales bacterium]|nr:hypothetical protein [Bacteroidales bacterium]MBD5240446.1 hypothetical protein [Bacteroidales bacterium]MBD5506198.1 hypothetical protein [Lachnospiraceae bacterium]
MNEEAIDLAAVELLESVSSSSTVFIEDKGSVGRITLEQLKAALNKI